MKDSHKIGSTLQRAWLLCAAAAVLAGGVYLNALHNPFIYDDHHAVVDNTSIHDVTDLRAIVLHDITRPLVNVSYAVDRAVWGEGPFGHHIGSVLLHMLNVILLFRLAWLLAGDRGLPPHVPAFTSAALFAVHPMMTEAVGYVSGRSEVLCTAWFVLALLCGRQWIKAGSQKGGARWAALTVLFWIAACASKETAAVFPMVLIAMDWLIGEDVAGFRRRLLRLYLPVLAVAVAAGVVRLLILRFEYQGRVAFHWPYILVELDVLRRYIGLLIAPAGQTLFHSVAAIPSLLAPRALAGIAALAFMLVLAWRIRRAAGAASLGIVWFLFALAPSSALAVLDQGEPMAEHRVYLASAGFFLAAGVGAAHLDAWLQRYGNRARWAGGAMMGAVLLSLFVQTLVRNAVWSDPIQVWQESVDLAPMHYRPRLLLGEALADKGRRAEAIVQYRIAIRLRPADMDGYLKLAVVLTETGQVVEARQALRQALAVDPTNETAQKALTFLNNMGPVS